MRRPKLDGFTGIVDAILEADAAPAFAALRRLLEARFGPRGKREYIQTLRLLEDFPERQVTEAVRDAVKRRLIGFDAVKHLLLARIERRPVHLDLSRYPHLPQPFVAATRATDYATLLAAGHGLRGQATAETLVHSYSAALAHNPAAVDSPSGSSIPAPSFAQLRPQ